MNKHRINESITCPQVRVVLEDKTSVVVETTQAIKMALEEGKDLVEIVGEATPPVCKIINYEKYKYQIEKEMKKKPKIIPMKEVQFGLKMGEADYKTKFNKVASFIAGGHKVSCSIILLKRQSSLWDTAGDVFARIVKELGDKVSVEKPTQKEKRKVFTIIAPNTKKKNKKPSESQNGHHPEEQKILDNTEN